MSRQIEISIKFIEIKERNSEKSSCYVEVIDEAGDGTYVYYPLADTWQQVKKSYPTFNEILISVGQVYEFDCEPEDFILKACSGHEGLYDDVVVVKAKKSRKKK